MSDFQKKAKPTLDSLLTEGQVITGKNLIKQKNQRDKELALFQEALEFEKRHRQPKAG